MDNFIKIRKNDPIIIQCIKKTNNRMILYTPLTTGGNIPNNVKNMIYSNYIKKSIK
jgi:hypothetical protein